MEALNRAVHGGDKLYVFPSVCQQQTGFVLISAMGFLFFLENLREESGADIHL